MLSAVLPDPTKHKKASSDVAAQFFNTIRSAQLLITKNTLLEPWTIHSTFLTHSGHSQYIYHKYPIEPPTKIQSNHIIAPTPRWKVSDRYETNARAHYCYANCYCDFWCMDFHDDLPVTDRWEIRMGIATIRLGWQFHKVGVFKQQKPFNLQPIV